MHEDALAAAAAHACAQWPLEACGVVIRWPDGRRAFVSVANVAAAPASRFELDPRAQLALWKEAAAGTFAIQALVHSHPDGSASLSAADRDAATTAGGISLHPGLEHWVLAIHGPAPRLVDATAHTWRMGVWTGRALVAASGADRQICIATQKRL